MGYKSMKIFSVFCAFLFISISAWGQTKHEIKAGETLYSISRQYGVTVQAIQAANPGLGETIMTGRVINIPAKSAQAPTQQNVIIQTTPTKRLLRRSISSYARRTSTRTNLRSKSQLSQLSHSRL